eukprot:EG_transcript_851
MAAWSISYGTSYGRLSTMASQFIALSQSGLSVFSSFVSDLMVSNAALVDSILDEQEASGYNRTEQTKAQMTRTIGVLVNYTANSTEQTQQQMDAVVNTFDDLMDTVVAQFKGLAGNYVAQIRLDSAAKGSASLASLVNAQGTAMQNIPRLINVGLLDLSRLPTDPVGVADCTLLAVLCDSSTAFYGMPMSVTSATGRFYKCSAQDGALISVRRVSGGVYNESYWLWKPSASSNPMRLRCLVESPVVEVVGTGCSSSQRCQCGADQRCTAWYRPFVNATTSYFACGVYTDSSGIPAVHSTLTLVNATAAPPTLLGLVDGPATLVQTQYLVPTVQGLAGQAYTALFLNDTNLSTYGSNVRKCPANTSQPGDPSLPTYSGFRSCDPGLRVVAQWIAGNRSLAQTVTLDIAGLLWDITPLRTSLTSYFFVVGTNKSDSYSAIDATEAMATSKLATTRVQLMDHVAASGAATRAYMAALGVQNVAATQAMQDRFLAEIDALENSSQASLMVSQAKTTTSTLALRSAQTLAVEAQKSSALAAMAVTAGWTIAMVCALVLAVLLLSAWGTIHVTRNLTQIIGLMEDLADMRVEALAVPQGSSVQEVARIQTAFQVMVSRLVEYKSYIPAGVFERLAQGKEVEAGSEDGHATDHSDSKTVSCVQSSSLSRDSTPGNRQSSDGGGTVIHLHPPARRSATKQVAVLAVNVVGFMDLLLASNEALSKTIFNEYVAQVHEVVSQGRGNIDFLSGDQVFATFNAHLPCGDPAGAAAAAALEVRQQLLRKLGDRFNFRVGVSFGSVFSGTVGYAKFKFMVTVGSPMKMSSILSHMDRLENGAVLVDANLQERMKYLYHFRPVEMLNLPWLKSFGSEARTSQRVFLLTSKKRLQEDEWLYQVDEGCDSSDWTKAFEQLVAAPSALEMQRILEQYLAVDPTDDLAVRLSDRLALWVPGKGIAV